jgi:predicted ribosomally synthesized peptide with SipW-like signal peptide
MAFTLSPRVKIFAAMGIVLSAAIGMTLAAFTDSGNVETTFTSGSLDLKFDNDQDGNPTNYLVDFSAGFDNLAPGDTVDRDLQVFNSGTINALVDLGAPQITNSAGTPASALQDSVTLVITDTTVPASPVQLYSGPLTSAAFTSLAIGSGGSANGRTLHFAVTLDSGASTDVAGQSITVVFPFSATQA